MIAIWIVGGLFLIVELIYYIPKYMKIIKCKEQTTGTIINSTKATGTGNQPIKANYEYSVDNVKYSKSTNWTNFGIFINGKECEVMYDKNNPNNSYIKRSGQIINCIIGTFFAIVGIGILCIGVVLNTMKLDF